MLILHSFGPAFGEPSASPFCTKILAMLNATTLDWRADFSADSRRAPMQKLPVLLDGDLVIPDSSAIRRHIETRAGIDFDEGLSKLERSQAHCLSRMAEEHLYFTLVYHRWVLDRNWEDLKARFFSGIPWPMRGVIAKTVRKDVIRNLKGQGLGRFDEDSLVERSIHDLVAIMDTLGRKPFLFGDRPTSADYSVAPVLSALANLPNDGVMRCYVREDAQIMEYVSRCRDVMYHQLGDLGEELVAA